MTAILKWLQMNIARHTSHTIISWPTPKQRPTIRISNVNMVIRWSTNILTIIKREVVELKTHILPNNMIERIDLILDTHRKKNYAKQAF